MRKILNQIGLYIWSGWCIFLFSFLCALFSPFLILVFLKSKKINRILLGTPKYISRVCMTCFGVKLCLEGKELIDPEKQYIFIANHSSNLDPLIPAACCYNHFKYIGKAEVLDIPIVGFVLKHLNFPVKREDKFDRLKVMDLMRLAVDDGAGIFFFPEGTRNQKPRSLLPFHDGAFKLSIEKQIPLAILTVINAWEICPPNQWLLKPGMLHCKWTVPLDPSKYSIEQLENYKEVARKIMLTEIENFYSP